MYMLYTYFSLLTSVEMLGRTTPQFSNQIDALVGYDVGLCMYACMCVSVCMCMYVVCIYDDTSVKF